MLGTLSSTTPCLSQVTVSHLDICGGFSRPNGTVREIHYLGGRKLTDVSRPKGKLAARPLQTPTHHLAASSAASIGVSLRLRY